MADKIVKITCRACGKTFSVKHPGREATLKYNCPACGAIVPVRFKAAPAPVQMAQKQAPAKQQPDKSIPGTVIAGANTAAGAYSGTFVSDTPRDTASPALRVTIHRPLLPDTVRDYPLPLTGAVTVGRADDSQPSDIAITGDTSVSRRSAVIEAYPGPHGSTYALRVVKTLNPIRVNDREIMQGESVGLSFGDIIIMGKTLMQFVNAKK